MPRAITACRAEQPETAISSSHDVPRLDDRHIDTLRAIARVLAPAAVEPPDVEHFTAALHRSFAVLTRAHARRLRTLITLLGTRAGVLLIAGSLRPLRHLRRRVPTLHSARGSTATFRSAAPPSRPCAV